MTTTDLDTHASARVLVVDDHDLFGQSLALALNADGFITERAREVTPAGILGMTADFAPDVVLLDLHLGPDGPTGVALAPQVRALGASVVMVTGVEEAAKMGECLEAGAVSVINKSEPYERLVRAVSEAAQQRSVMSSEQRRGLLAAMREDRAESAKRTQGFEQLSATEQIVLAGLMEGKSADAIARERFVTVRTVRTQIEAILAKLRVRSQLGAVALAWRSGWMHTAR